MYDFGFISMGAISFVVYMPLFIGQRKKNEESLFWASVISLILTTVALIVMGNGDFKSGKPVFLPLLVSFLFGFVAYGIYRMNFPFKRSKFSPFTWLAILPVVDNIVFRGFGLHYLSMMSQEHQLLAWYVPLNVVVMALVCAVAYFFIFFRNGLFRSFWESGMAFVIALVSGYIYMNYGFTDALISQFAFNLWRIVFSKRV